MKKVSVLFVDDEINVLKSLKRSMLPTGYNVITAKTSLEAIDILEREKIDIFVSDVKMPEISGVELLLYVKKHFPQVHRMILSGYIETEHVLRAILNSTSFDYLSKPWDNDELVKKIEHIVRIRDVLGNPEIRRLVHDIDGLPVIPEVYNRFEKAVDAEASVEEISRIIQDDIGMSSKVLQLANTAFYSKTQVNSIKKAVAIVGVRNIKQLMFASIFLQEDSLEKWQIDELRRMSELFTRTNKILCAYHYYCYQSKMRDDYGALGYTFDIGRLILLRFRPEYYKKVLLKMAETNKDFHACEVLLGNEGATHMEIGGYFLNLWNFSRISIEASIFHHEMEKISEEFLCIIELLYLAYQSAVKNESGYLQALENPHEIDWASLNFESFLEAKGKLDKIRVSC